VSSKGQAVLFEGHRFAGGRAHQRRAPAGRTWAVSKRAEKQQKGRQSKQHTSAPRPFSLKATGLLGAGPTSAAPLLAEPDLFARKQQKSGGSTG
jgi:hypothetical protein